MFWFMNKVVRNSFTLMKFFLLPSLLSVMLFIFTSCEREVFYDESQKIPNRTWSMHQFYPFEVDFQDTVSTYDFYLTFRHTVDYPNRNIFFFLRTYYPDSGITRQDTIECFLADDYGHWLGKDNGDVRDVRMKFASGIKLPMQGKYKFELRHASRDSILTYIADVGIRILNHEIK